MTVILFIVVPRGVIASLTRRRSLIRCPEVALSVSQTLSDCSLRHRSADRRLVHFHPFNPPV